MPHRHGEHDIAFADNVKITYRIIVGHVEEKAAVDSSFMERAQLLRRDHFQHLDHDIWRGVPELVNRGRCDAIPRGTIAKTYLDRAQFSVSDGLGARGNFVKTFEQALRISEKACARGRQSYSAWEALKKLYSDLSFQVLNLSCESGLRNFQPLRGTPEMYLFRDGAEIAQLPKLHAETISFCYRNAR